MLLLLENTRFRAMFGRNYGVNSTIHLIGLGRHEKDGFTEIKMQRKVL
jgi:hypothetical protein